MVPRPKPLSNVQLSNSPFFHRYFLEPKAAIMSDGAATVKANIAELEVIKQNKAAVELKFKEVQKELTEFK